MKALVTGAAGFIGSHVSETLIADGVSVVALDDLSGGFRENVPLEAEFVQGSITDRDLLESLFEEHEFEYVYHLAAYAAEGLSHFIRRFNYDNNLMGSINLINLGVRHKIKAFVFTSSIAVYGAIPPPMDETMTPDPEDPYGIAKYAIELDLRAAHKQFGLPYIIFRPHNVYGERQNIGDKYRNVIGIFMNQILNDESLTIFGDGEQTRAFSYIADVAPIIARSVQCCAAYGEVFNIGGDTPTSVNELAEIVMQAMDAPSEIVRVQARNEVVHAYACHDKARRILGVVSPTPLATGIETMAQWVKTYGPRSTKPFRHIEITDGLPDGWKPN